MLTSTFNLKGTAQTVQTLARSTTSANTIVKRGERIGLDFGGALTSLVGVCVTVVLKPLSPYRMAG